MTNLLYLLDNTLFTNISNRSGSSVAERRITGPLLFFPQGNRGKEVRILYTGTLARRLMFSRIFVSFVDSQNPGSLLRSLFAIYCSCCCCVEEIAGLGSPHTCAHTHYGKTISSNFETNRELQNSVRSQQRVKELS